MQVRRNHRDKGDVIDIPSQRTSRIVLNPEPVETRIARHAKTRQFNSNLLPLVHLSAGERQKDRRLWRTIERGLDIELIGPRRRGVNPKRKTLIGRWVESRVMQRQRLITGAGIDHLDRIVPTMHRTGIRKVQRRPSIILPAILQRIVINREILSTRFEQPSRNDEPYGKNRFHTRRRLTRLARTSNEHLTAPVGSLE